MKRRQHVALPSHWHKQFLQKGVDSSRARRAPRAAKAPPPVVAHGSLGLRLGRIGWSFLGQTEPGSSSWHSGFLALDPVTPRCGHEPVFFTEYAFHNGVRRVVAFLAALRFMTMSMSYLTTKDGGWTWR